MPIPSQGNVITPTGFTAVSQEAQVSLSWNASPNAAIYYISRSTDNVTFTELSTVTPPVLSYQDTTAVVGTIYYYILQSGDGTSSSLPTLSISGQALLPGQTTLGNIRLQAKQRCDRVNSQFVTDQEWNTYIDQSYRELYDLILQKFGNDYYVAAPYSFQTSQNQPLYPLPGDFYKLLGVEVQLNQNDPNSYVTLRKFEFIQRNLWNYPNVYTFYGVTNLRYRLNGNNIMLVPLTTSGQILRLWYAPRPNQLINDTDTLDCISGWEELIVLDACIKAMVKEESDISAFAAQKMAMLTRLESAAENRDIGEPETVSDSRRRNLAWDDGDSGGGYGGSWGL
jgi:hypothetical protein